MKILDPLYKWIICQIHLFITFWESLQSFSPKPQFWKKGAGRQKSTGMNHGAEEEAVGVPWGLSLPPSLMEVSAEMEMTARLEQTPESQARWCPMGALWCTVSEGHGPGHGKHGTPSYGRTHAATTVHVLGGHRPRDPHSGGIVQTKKQKKTMLRYYPLLTCTWWFMVSKNWVII